MADRQALTLTLQDPRTLAAAYMPSLERGGIFVPTRERYALGEEVALQLTLPDAQGPVALTGRVVWISPPGVSGRRRPGIGIHFDDQAQGVRQRIEGLLEGLGGEGQPSHTL